MGFETEEQARIRDLEAEVTRFQHKDDQVAAVTNDLNNLLAAMKGQAQLACDDPSGEEKDELVRVVLSATLRAESILRRLAEPAPWTRAPTEANEKPGEGPAHILVVDDEHTMLDLLGRILTKSGYRVSLASTGQEAIAQCKENRFDLAFLDMQLGEMKGTDVFKELMVRSPETHVIFVSGDPNMEKEAGEASSKQKPTTFIRKPFDVNEIKQRVSYILTMKSALA